MGKLRQDWADPMPGWEAIGSRPPSGKGGNKGATGEGTGRKQETIEKLSPPCARSRGCSLPFRGVPATGTPSREPLRAAFASGPMGWGKDEASSPPTPCRASLPRVLRRGVRSSVSLFSFILGPQSSGGHTAHVALPWAKGALPPLLVCLKLPGNCETEGPWGGGRKPLKNNQEKRAG